jgi:hypothetical protein
LPGVEGGKGDKPVYIRPNPLYLPESIARNNQIYQGILALAVVTSAHVLASATIRMEKGVLQGLSVPP